MFELFTTSRHNPELASEVAEIVRRTREHDYAATIELLGRWNWWLPRPLARVLPKASFEELPVPSPA